MTPNSPTTTEGRFVGNMQDRRDCSGSPNMLSENEQDECLLPSGPGPRPPTPQTTPGRRITLYTNVSPLVSCVRERSGKGISVNWVVSQGGNTSQWTVSGVENKGTPSPKVIFLNPTQGMVWVVQVPSPVRRWVETQPS